MYLGVLLAGPALAQPDPRTALLEREGWEALNAGRLAVAADAFARALAADPRNARLHLGAGTAAYLEHRDEDARVALTRALALDPKLSRAQALLGLVLYRRGDLDAAIRAYERLVAGTPETEGAATTLERWRREAEVRDRMSLAIGSGFTVSFEGPPEAEIATRVTASVERALGRIAQVLSTYPAEPIRVVLYTADQFRDITRAPEWAAGAYDGTIRIPVRDALASERELDRVVAHEVTHALVHGLAPRGVPAWLNEGLASALERDETAGAEVEAAVRDPSPSIPLRSLEAPFGRLPAARVRLAYAASARAVRRLLEEAGGFAVASLLKDLGSGLDLDRAFLRRIYLSLDDFEAGLNP
jgi:tetratricopeptide (TPR) repeat protein